MLMFFSILAFFFGGEKVSPNYLGQFEKHVTPKLDSYFSKKGFYVYGVGGSALDCIRSQTYSLSLNRQVLEDEAVEIFLSLYPEALKIINDCKEIRFYLYEYPATSQSLHIGIQFRDSNNNHSLYPYVHRIVNSGNSLLIYYYDPVRKLSELKPRKEYSLSELLKARQNLP